MSPPSHSHCRKLSLRQARGVVDKSRLEQIAYASPDFPNTVFQSVSCKSIPGLGVDKSYPHPSDGLPRGQFMHAAFQLCTDRKGKRFFILSFLPSRSTVEWAPLCRHTDCRRIFP